MTQRVFAFYKKKSQPKKSQHKHHPTVFLGCQHGFLAALNPTLVGSSVALRREVKFFAVKTASHSSVAGNHLKQSQQLPLDLLAILWLGKFGTMSSQNPERGVDRFAALVINC